MPRLEFYYGPCDGDTIELQDLRRELVIVRREATADTGGYLSTVDTFGKVYSAVYRLSTSDPPCYLHEGWRWE